MSYYQARKHLEDNYNYIDVHTEPGLYNLNQGLLAFVEAVEEDMKEVKQKAEEARTEAQQAKP